MRCPKCRNVIHYADMPNKDDLACTMCRNPMVPTAQDVLQDGLFSIAREIRPTQVKLAQDVERVFRKKEGATLLAEGGTGIGKSFAYLIPALLSSNAGRIVISTAKKALQHQLAGSASKPGDIPFLLDRMNVRRKFALYKGNGNYACWHLEEEVPAGIEREAYKKFIQVSRGSGTPADLANWPGSKPFWWHKVTVENCVRRNSCSDAGNCRVNPKDFDVLVVNHHILSIDLLSSEGLPGRLLGFYDTLIVDEAHNLPDAFRSIHTQSISPTYVEKQKSKFKKDNATHGVLADSGITTTKRVLNQYDDLEGAVNALLLSAYKAAEDQNGTISDTAPLLSAFADVSESLGVLTMTLTHIFEYAEKAYADSQTYTDGTTSPGKLHAVMARVKRYGRSLARVKSLLSELEREATFDDHVPQGKFLIIYNEEGLHAKPLMVGELLGPPMKRMRHKVITSATLAQGGNFEYTKSLFGVDEAVERIYDSPFDTQTQSVLYMPTDIIPPQHQNTERRDEWIEAIGEEIYKITTGLDGNVFVLFSARGDMNEVARYIGDRMRDAKLNLVVQEDNADHSESEYRNNPRSVLFGLKSFWEGVDIPGDKLRGVIIPKLPFPYAGDPIMRALDKKLGRDFFSKVYIPLMMIDLKQGVGRLLRSKDDRGMLAILDPRAWTGSSKKHKSIMVKVKAALEAEWEGKYGGGTKFYGYGRLISTDLNQVNITNDFTTAIAFAKQLLTGVKHVP